MGAKPQKLIVSYSPHALAELDEIWSWNASRCGLAHADDYTAFLRAKANQLATGHNSGKDVPGIPGFKFVIVQRRSKAHGHIVVYEIIHGVVEILHFFHTAQNWQEERRDKTP